MGHNRLGTLLPPAVGGGFSALKTGKRPKHLTADLQRLCQGQHLPTQHQARRRNPAAGARDQGEIALGTAQPQGLRRAQMGRQGDPQHGISGRERRSQGHRPMQARALRLGRDLGGWGLSTATTGYEQSTQPNPSREERSTPPEAPKNHQLHGAVLEEGTLASYSACLCPR